ncbi:MAG: recombinase family protein [Oscillospiraceae bacterium]|jgi:DNA invertase Pin-like site-specific DNA recombinase|nr:recombinase family protein [Oscillospiraceae bacterium]
MKLWAYVRVSAIDQNTSRQLDAMTALKIPPERIFVDKLSGKDTARPQLRKLLTTVRRGDTVVVESISRFARNTRDLLDLVEQLTSKGVDFVSQKEHIDTTTPTGKFMLTVFGAVAELERGYILQRQAEGIAAAKARGVHFGRPELALPEDFGKLVRQWEQGKLPLENVLNACGMGRSTFYTRLHEYRLLHGQGNNKVQ